MPYIINTLASVDLFEKASSLKGPLDFTGLAQDHDKRDVQATRNLRRLAHVPRPDLETPHLGRVPFKLLAFDRQSPALFLDTGRLVLKRYQPRTLF